MEETKKKPKKQGPIRWEAVIPFTIVSILFVVYMSLFFDTHLKSLMEWTGYHVVGAEVNIKDVKTSFTKGNIRIQGIEVTDSLRPAYNSFGIGDIRFGLIWDGLFKARFIIEEMAVEQIEIGTPRKRPGKVKPPPKEKKPEGPGFIESEAQKLQTEALDKAQSEYGNNLLGDIASLLSGTSAGDQLQNIEATLKSKTMLQSLDADLKTKQAIWDQRLKTLPTGPEIQALNQRLSKVKTNNFKSPQELETSLKEIDQIFKEADSKVKHVQQTGSDLDKELKGIQSELQSIEKQINSDIKDLEARFRIPSLDAKSISQALFKRYMDPIWLKIAGYRETAEKYIPPKFKDQSGREDIVQPHPRSKGVVYEFNKPNSYPMFWIKKVSISSQAGASPQAGQVSGKITDITSNQALIGKPTILDVKGDFPGLEILGWQTHMTLDNRKSESEISMKTVVKQYPLDAKTLLDSDEGRLAFNKAMGALSVEANLKSLRDLNLQWQNQFTKIDYDISAKNEVVQDIFKGIFEAIPAVSLNVNGSGLLPRFGLNMNSNLGVEVEKGFRAQIQKKVDEAKVKLQAYVHEQVGKEKARIESEINKVKSQIDGEVKKIQAQLDAEKVKAEQSVQKAKKDAENQAKAKVEDEIKKKAEDLKKRLGL